ncbi:HAMP domain-containing sensor histidine kinase [Streptomyces sp. RFCAC02]|uniref:sensor histidine kinase n=1 Tax=Streptomyces sp. RFCAC02 TaxID=2499143 RepID=UPI00143DC467|nr:HAMP domain-containing sensor histidine kinase [Streptomyces sp. RFCAC02]
MGLTTRFTLIYGGLFLAAGVVLLGITYVLVDHRLDVDLSAAPDTAGGTPTGPAARDAVTEDGTVLHGDAADEWLRGQRTRLNDNATRTVLVQGGLALLAVTGAAAVCGRLVAGRVLAPLHRVTETALRIADAPAAGRGLHERIALRGPDDEVKDLAHAFNTMVERLDRSFDGQRRFVANASHELRTPLTLGRALVELAVSEEDASADTRRLGGQLLELNASHERLISGLLLLAGSEQEIPDRRPVDLADIAAHVAELHAPEADRAGIALHEASSPAPTTGDALLLERLVHNLVENGLRHNTGAGGWVRITARTRDDGRAEVTVSNSGPVVPPGEVPTLFEPFRRFGAERLVGARGAGLGLSIVRSTALVHGGEVTATARQDGGLVVTVVLPGDPSC